MTTAHHCAAGSPHARARAAEVLTEHADAVSGQVAEQKALWNKGFTRRRFIAGAGMVGAATLASQLVTTKVAYSAPGASTGHTVITIFMRGGADGLRILSPLGDAHYLRAVRPQLVLEDRQTQPLPGAPGWAMNAELAPLLPLWQSGELTFVPAVSAAGTSRSHFQAQQYLEHGGSDTIATGWLDRVLQQLGRGTTFRAVSEGDSLPASMSGTELKLAMRSLDDFKFPGWDAIAAKSETAVRALYRGMSGPLGEDVPATLSALRTAAKARRSDTVHNGAQYPGGGFGRAMSTLATLLRSEVGVQVATVDVGGWDTHTDEAGDLDRNLREVATTLAAFMTDLGPARRSRVTVVLTTEFGRRVYGNDSGGCDHGHGSVMWLVGGGLRRSQVAGRWGGLNDRTLDQGDVPGWNSAFDVLGEVVQQRLGVGRLDTIFPGHRLHPLGLAHR